eukprot:m.165768 g.165768  ORF g.165768 m.165768 type:complete len:822 (+) comp31396_c0_seq1:19-2484(+)
MATQAVQVSICIGILFLVSGSNGAKHDAYDPLKLIEMLNKGKYLGNHPDAGAPTDFECSWRAAAFVQAKAIQPFLTEARQKVVHDALELTTLCNTTFTAWDNSASATMVEYGCAKTGVSEICVEIVVETYDDLLQALETSKHAPVNRTTHVLIKAGATIHLNETILLTPAHSNTVISPTTAGSAPTISGSRVLDVTWQQYKTPRGISAFVADVPKGLRGDALHVDGRRATVARYPNANPETDQFPTGWIPMHGVESLPPLWKGNTTNYSIALPGAFPGDFAGTYRVGTGGACKDLTPPESYWCQPDGRVADHTYFVRTPSGINNAGQFLPNSPYKSVENATLFYWRPGHWFTIMYEVESMDPDGRLVFGKGGFQGAEGHDTVAEWFISGVLEELDYANEFYYDGVNGKLHLVYNGSGTPPSTIELPALAELILFEGTQSTPVVNVEITGLNFTGTRPTYLEPHGLPSGGDWGLERMGAIRLAGTKSVSITNNVFTTLDGNAIFLDGFNRETLISHNEFYFLGASAIALWGYDNKGYDADGNQPRFTNVSNNFCHEIGIYQKQSSCYFQAVSAQNSITNNLFFNGPRAMVNFNDAFGGGHDLGYNVLFNSCRESSDHGAFNSWDRQPYVTTVLDGKTPSAQPAYSKLHHNFIVANYAANGGCFDNDDGSSWYLEQSNFCVFGGMKSNFEGHNKRTTNSLHAFASVYGDTCLNGLVQVSEYYADAYANNTCILSKANDSYLEASQQNANWSCTVDKNKPIDLILGDNIVYAPGAEVVVHVCREPMSGADWLKLGLDVGTTILDASTLTSKQIIASGMSILARA